MQLFLIHKHQGADNANEVENAANDCAQHQKTQGEQSRTKKLECDDGLLIFILVRQNIESHGHNTNGLTDKC